MEPEPQTPDAFARLTAQARQQAHILLQRARQAWSNGMRALRTPPAQHSPTAFARLAPRRASFNYVSMGDSDLQAVLERRAIVARELAALEAARADMVAEDQELMVAERVLRRLGGAEMVETRSERTSKLAYIAEQQRANDKEA